MAWPSSRQSPIRLLMASRRARFSSKAFCSSAVGGRHTSSLSIWDGKGHSHDAI